MNIVGKMAILKTDQRRRVTLSKELVGKYGRKFVAIRTKEGILLKPLPEDPIKALQEALAPLKGVPIAEIKRRAYRRAVREAVKKWSS